jgi:hypothetical protein
VGGVSFPQDVRGYGAWDHFLESGDTVILDRWISPFVQSQAGGGVRMEEMTDPLMIFIPVLSFSSCSVSSMSCMGAGGGNHDFSL